MFGAVCGDAKNGDIGVLAWIEARASVVEREGKGAAQAAVGWVDGVDLAGLVCHEGDQGQVVGLPSQ